MKHLIPGSHRPACTRPGSRRRGAADRLRRLVSGGTPGDARVRDVLTTGSTGAVEHVAVRSGAMPGAAPFIAAAVLGAATILGAAAGLAGCASGSGFGDRYPSPAQRQAALRKVADNRTASFQSIAARLQLGVDRDLAFRQLDTLLSSPTGDMFWTYPATAFYFSCREKLDAGWRERFRLTWKRYTPYRGDTENHFLMHYGALLLFAQEWPDLPGSEWFNGKSSRENYDEASSYLNHWIDEVTREGMTEWDSPRYAYFYLTPLLTLAEYTADPVLRRRFGMMAEYILADYANDYLAGAYTGAHSRDGDGSVIEPRLGAEATSYGQFFFEDSLSMILPDLALAALYRFQAPPILAAIAHDRSGSWAQTERKRSRARMRFARERFAAVERYTFMTPDYAIGSIAGGLQQPIQQHTWGITFAADRPNATIFALHPDVSASELGMFFPEEPELMEENVVRSKGSYGSPDKWVGGSRYESIGQYRSTLVGLYDLPAGARHRHVDIFIPRSLDTLLRDVSGWTVGRMGGALVGIRVLRGDSVAWIEEPKSVRIRISGRAIRYAVECASLRETTLEQFVARLGEARVPPISSTELVYQSPFGPRLRFERVTGAPAPWSLVEISGTRRSPMPGEKLFDGPHLSSERGSGVLELSAGGMRRVLDFVDNIIR